MHVIRKIFLVLSHNKIGPEGVIALTASTLLRELDLMYNNVGDGIIAFAQNHILTSLKLSSESISFESLAILLQNNHLEALVVEDSQFAALWGNEVVD